MLGTSGVELNYRKTLVSRFSKVDAVMQTDRSSKSVYHVFCTGRPLWLGFNHPKVTCDLLDCIRFNHSYEKVSKFIGSFATLFPNRRGLSDYHKMVHRTIYLMVKVHNTSVWNEKLLALVKKLHGFNLEKVVTLQSLHVWNTSRGNRT